MISNEQSSAIVKRFRIIGVILTGHDGRRDILSSFHQRGFYIDAEELNIEKIPMPGKKYRGG